MGTALGIALRRAGYRIGPVVTKQSKNARRAVKLIGAGTPYSWKQFVAATPALIETGIVIIATPDDVTKDTAQELAAHLPSPSSARRHLRPAFHTSGALSSEVLNPLRRRGLTVASLHPLLSISASRAGADKLHEAFFSLEGDASARRVGQRLVRDLGGRSFTIRAADKALYHAAALMASPNMTALFDIALEMMVRCGLSPGRAREVLLPLVQSTLDNLARQDPARALTGTFKRGDVATVKTHLAAIKSGKLSDALAAYVLLGNRSLKLAKLAPAEQRLLKSLLSSNT
jgi:predicted short-subunit dehydrogenase-like oxidoreductase (DUF2520 family)